MATLKASKQEATGFSIPIEDFQEALAKLAKQPSLAADRCRSQHRLKNAVRGLGSGGALMCMVIDLRRATATSNSADLKDMLARLEPVATLMDQEIFPSLIAQPPRISNDPLIDKRIKNQVAAMAANFTSIRGMFAGRMAFDNNQLRAWKQTHKQLLTDLSAALKLEIAEGMMVAFDDHEQSQSTILTLGPQSSFGMYGPRFGPRFGSGMPGVPRGFSRPPGIGPRRGIR